MDGKRKASDGEADGLEHAAKKAYSGAGTAEFEHGAATTAIVFTLSEKMGILADTLEVFKKRKVNLKHIESRPSRCNQGEYDFYVDIDVKKTPGQNIRIVLQDLKAFARNVFLHNQLGAPWYPRKISDLDKFADRVLSYGAELDSDHPGFTDKTYRDRRKEFADIAIKYRHGEPLPYVEYTEEEIITWNTVFTELTKLYPTHACRELNFIFPLLVENCGYKLGQIPQLREVSKFLKECTGFTLRPVAGLLSPRDFLAGLAFRVFHSTQYIRHGANPMYTPEPDVVHELIGHVPMFADPSFAQFSQEIGLASLGAPDEWIEKLSTLYWFTVEFGLCRQNGETKAYGAGLLSSFGELQYCLSDKPALNGFDPEKIATTKYPITEYQPQYFVAESFDEAKNKVRQWASKIPKPFALRYNPYTQCVETLEEKSRIINLVREMRSDMDRLEDALHKVP